MDGHKTSMAETETLASPAETRPRRDVEISRRDRDETFAGLETWPRCWNWHILPCSTSTARDRKRCSVTLNKNSTRAFQWAINYGSTPPLLPHNGDKVPKFVVFWTISTIKDEKSTEKFHYIKTLSGKVVAQSIAFRVVSIYWLGVAQFPWYLNAKGPTRIGSTCVAHTSPHSAAAVTSLRH